jgi:polyphosphate kinase
LRPGVPGVSETITVRAIIDRFLEHSRIAYWENGGEPELYLGSADWMPRNLNRRIEVSFPVLDPMLIERIRDEILMTELTDNTSTWRLSADGSYEALSPAPGDTPIRAQQIFMALARQRGKAARTTVRREFQARSASGALAMNPVLRAVELRSRRRNRG